MFIYTGENNKAARKGTLSDKDRTRYGLTDTWGTRHLPTQLVTKLQLPSNLPRALKIRENTIRRDKEAQTGLGNSRGPGGLSEKTS